MTAEAIEHIIAARGLITGLICGRRSQVAATRAAVARLDDALNALAKAEGTKS